MELDIKIVVSLVGKGLTPIGDETVPQVIIKFYFMIWVLTIWVCSL